MYASVMSLPPEVKTVLSPEAQEIWRTAFNVFEDGKNPNPAGAAWLCADPTMDKSTLAFCVDLQGMEFAEDAVTWVHAMPLGNYSHPMHGEIPIDFEAVKQFADNVNNNVRDQELDIDYDHKAQDGRAAGWVKGAQVRDSGLWLGVQWTGEALKHLKDKAYRYFSPEFLRQWTHPRTNVTHKNVMLGGALTNRPFLKGILPINMSEMLSDVQNQSGENMLEELRKLLGLPDTATEAEVLAAAKPKLEATPPLPPAGSEGSEGTESKGTTPPEGAENESKNEPIAASEEVIRLNERIAMLEAANRVSDVTVRLSELDTTEGAKFAVTPTAKELLKGLALDAPNAQYSDKLFQFAESVLKDGIVELGERVKRGGPPTNHDAGGTAGFVQAVEKYQAEKKCSFREASEAVALTEPELFDEYRNASYIKTRGDDS